MPTKASAAKAKSQPAIFKRDARALGCDESEATFDKALTKIGRANVAKNDVTPKQRRAKKKPLKLAI